MSNLYKGAPQNFNGTGTSYNPHQPQPSPSTSKGAPLFREEAHFFDEDTYEFSVSPEPSPIPFEHWEVSDNETDFNWDKYEDCTEAVMKCLRK